MSGKEEMKEVLCSIEELTEYNPCRMPDIVMRGIALGAKFLMRNYVMNRQQAADYFGVSKKTIDRWRVKHGFPCEEPDGSRELSIMVDKMLEWKRTHKHVWDV